MRERCLNIEATNETFSTRVNVLEKCRYYVSCDSLLYAYYYPYFTLLIFIICKLHKL